MARDERKSNSRFVDLDQEIPRSKRATYAAYLIARERSNIRKHQFIQYAIALSERWKAATANFFPKPLGNFGEAVHAMPRPCQ
ncbi:MAG TPA: hypothetical protein DCR78_18095 [Pseudomonas sp.]|nr:hypothetical protein [Pseudomonas sp.]